MSVPPFVVISGPEGLLAERALASIVLELRHSEPDLEVIKVAPAAYERGVLAQHASPSLFGGTKAIVVEDFDDGGEELQSDVSALLAAPAPDITLIVLHKSGQRGKRVLDALKAAGARVIDCPAIKSDRDKSDFVTHEFRRQQRKVTPDAVQALVEAVGRDLRELAAACSQLVADTEGTVDDRAVETYHGGKVEASGFRVADMTIAGQPGEALRLLRHALASGVDPVPIVAVLASQLRILVKVGAAGRGTSAAIAKAVGMAPWQVDKARRSIGHWDGPGLGVAIQAVAAADVEVKGGGRDPVYAVERAILAITAARSRGGR
ncbi:MAG: DNA polymerase III subunit delta [Candidatus Phosphoribacter sp.]